MIWLQAHGLNDENILEYFSTSPFYDKESNNQILRNQGIHGFKAYEQLIEMTGLEFNLNSSSKNPRLFVINKGIRSNSREVEVTDIFYCLDGSIFQTPSFTSLLRSRISKASNKLVSSHNHVCSLFEISQGNLDEEEKEESNSTSTQVGPIIFLPSMKNTLSQLAGLSDPN